MGWIVFLGPFFNIFWGNSLGTSRMDMNGWVTDLSTKYSIRVLPLILICRCTSGIVVLISTSACEKVIARVALEVDFVVCAGGVLLCSCLAMRSCLVWQYIHWTQSLHRCLCVIPTSVWALLWCLCRERWEWVAGTCVGLFRPSHGQYWEERWVIRSCLFWCVSCCKTVTPLGLIVPG